MRELAALSLAGAVCGVVGGVIFWAVHGGTPLTRSIAYGLWFAATVVLVLTVVAGQEARSGGARACPCSRAGCSSRPRSC